VTNLDRQWLLKRGADVLGWLTETGLDQPWIICRFEPTEQFVSVQPLFDDVFRLINEDDDWNRAEALQKQIDALGLTLEISGGQKIINEFVLSIGNGEAWFRY